MPRSYQHISNYEKEILELKSKDHFGGLHKMLRSLLKFDFLLQVGSFCTVCTIWGSSFALGSIILKQLFCYCANSDNSVDTVKLCFVCAVGNNISVAFSCSGFCIAESSFNALNRVLFADNAYTL